MPKTLLAVDDSATMRKVLEITFSGEDFRVLGADGATKALAQLAEGPIAAVIDTSLERDDGYALAKEIRSRDARIAILLMASRYCPYDANRGRDAGVDDFVDKPFDTQSLIDKLRRAIGAREAGKGAAVAVAPAVHDHAPAHAPAPAPVPATSTVPSTAAVPAAPNVTSGVHFAPSGAAPRPGPSPSGPRSTFPGRTHTLSFEQSGPPPAAAPPAPASLPRGAPPGIAPAPPRPPGPPPAPQHAPAATTLATSPPGGRAPASATIHGQITGKLEELGLSADQIEAVVALSREVVERVVWEVVPQLAETLIKEEIARLTRAAPDDAS